MAAKDTVRNKLSQLNWQSVMDKEVHLQTSTLLRGAEVGIHFLLAAVLSGATIFGSYAPFGVAFVGAAGSGLCGGSALVGAFCGYMLLLGFGSGLRYAAAAILTFAIHFAFYDVKLLRHPWVMPGLTGLLVGCTGFVYLSKGGWRTVDVIYFATELAMTVCVCWCYGQLFVPMRQGRGEQLLSSQKRASVLILLCTVLLSLSGLTLWQEISLGRWLAAAVVLAVAWQGGCTAGAVVGIALGLSMDLAANGMPLYAMAYGLSGLLAGGMRQRLRIQVALIYLLANGGAVLWTWERGLPLSILYEVLLGAMTFLCLPQQPLKRLGSWLTPAAAATLDSQSQLRAKERLEATASAFRNLYDTLRTSLRPIQNDQDVATVFDRAACRVCKGCSLRSDCWERNYVTTFNALNDATQGMLDRGHGVAGDFPQYFSSRCLHFPAFLGAINQELTALLCRRQYQSRIQDSRWAVCRQYHQLATLLGTAAAELGEELTPDPTASRKLSHYLSTTGWELESAALRDGKGRLRLELQGADCGAFTTDQTLTALIELLQIPLRWEEQGTHRLVLIQQEPLMAVAGVVARRKDGETVSGDAGTYFKRGDGTLYLLLCDGMGSGTEAHRESSLALRILEQFLQAGVETEHALLTLNSALALRGEDTGGFTTIDLLQLNLFTGDGMIFKLGAAPTYIKKGESVRRITGSALPAGLTTDERTAPDASPVHLNPGDCVLMVSDGVLGTEDDQWLRDRLLHFQGSSPKELAHQLIANSPEEATDDRTALVVRIERRSQSV